MEGVGETPALASEPSIEQRPSDKKKVPRKRMRKLFASIREQMEFYFSDANLRRDRYLRKEIEQGVDGYVPLTVFQSFNKMKAICTDPATVALALRKCCREVLEVSEDGLRVRRKAPIPNESQADIDNRTVYVECLPQHVDHEWIKTVFNGYGKIAYISLPRWKTSGDPKGFAFIEFETSDGAQVCCQAFQGSADFGTARCFPKGSKQLLQLRRRAAVEDVQVELLTSLPTAADDAMTTDEPEAANKDGEEVAPRRKPKRKRKKAETVSEEEDDDDEQNPARKARSQKDGRQPKKQRKNDRGNNVPAEELVPASATSTDAARNAHGLDSGNEETDVADDPSGNVQDSSVTDVSHSERQPDDDATSSEDKTEQGKGGVPRRSRKKRKSKKVGADKSEHQLELDMLKLKVIPKSQWLRLRSEYLNLQKLNMAALKKALQQHASTSLPSEETDRRADGKGSCKGTAVPATAGTANQKPTLPPIDFVPNVIVRVTCSKGTMTHQSVKASLPTGLEVAYVDVTDGANDGFIRCKAEAAAELLCSTGSIGDLSFTALRGSEEQAYWNKLRADREQKRNRKRSDGSAAKKKLRGVAKIAAKAEKMTAMAMAAAAGTAAAIATEASAPDSQVPNRHTRFEECV